MKRANLVISGRVQGVMFRRAARNKAEELGCTGWVRNLLDGSVRAVCEGGDEQVDAFVSWCRSGPRAARVEKIEVSEDGYTGEFDRFEVLPFGF